MDFDALLAMGAQFSSEGIGATITRIALDIYNFLYPANSDPAHVIEIPL